MENRNADLSGLRINRTQDEEPQSRRRGSALKTILFAAIAIVVVVLGYILFSRMFESALEVQLSTASFSSPSQANAVLTASGYVVAQRKAAVASKATGRLMYLGVVEGDRAKKGQVLARIEDTDIKATLDQARANLQLYEADLKDAAQWLDRQKKLLQSGVSTQSDYDGAEARYRRVLASIDVAKAMVVGAEVSLENTLIRAPFDGTVLTKNADVGEMVVPMAASASSKSAVVTIADMSSLQVETDVSESNIERIIPDQPCEITLDAYPAIRYRGFVAKVVPTADRAKATVMVKVGFRSYDSKVLPEMSAKVLFLTKAAEAAASTAKPMLTIPLSSVATRGGKKVVFTVRENQAVESSIVVGKEFGAFVEVTQGLSSGDKVISNVTEQITAGSRVKIR
ncbi:MAG: efflux RND transporter periplasmic adaptor subunit [Ignavibacteriales bacterium]|nr:efflux RND transporter periplasmic adaptor subunit [Ignavibacteriales bacterium]